MAIRDITGKQFGRLTVLSFDHIGRGGAYWLCRCECGEKPIVLSARLANGTTSSCGCLARDRWKASRTTHGLSKHPLYTTWVGMHRRCYDEADDSYPRYGGRGIRVCDGWHGSGGLRSFISDMGPKPSRRHSIDRIDVNGQYEPGNCRWATAAVQGANKENTLRVDHEGSRVALSTVAHQHGLGVASLNWRVQNGWALEEALAVPMAPPRVLVEFRGEAKEAKEWESVAGVPAKLIVHRIRVYGWGPERAVTEPVRPANRTYTHNGETHTVAEWAAKLGVGAQTLRRRLLDGWPLEKALAPLDLRSKKARASGLRKAEN